MAKKEIKEEKETIKLDKKEAKLNKKAAKQAKAKEEGAAKEYSDVPIRLKWFSWSGISNEIKRIRWSSPKDLFSDTGKVLIFCICFGVYFVLCDLLVSQLLLLMGIGA